MKKTILFLSTIFLLASCYQQPPQVIVAPQSQAVVAPPVNPNDPYYEVRQDPYSNTQVVYVRANDGTSYFLDYLVFQSLWGNGGGYGAVNNYYIHNRSTIISQGSHYSNYRTSYTSRDNNRPNNIFRSSGTGSYSPASKTQAQTVKPSTSGTGSYSPRSPSVATTPTPKANTGYSPRPSPRPSTSPSKSYSPGRRH